MAAGGLHNLTTTVYLLIVPLVFFRVRHFLRYSTRDIFYDILRETFSTIFNDRSKLETGGRKFTAKGQHSITENEETFQRERWDKRSFSRFGMCLFSNFSPSLLLNFCNQALFDFKLIKLIV